MSLVRAIDSVPRRFFLPLVASFLMGARVFFCFMPGSKPPPWIMKPGMTRWKMTPSKNPSSTYSWKFFAEIGASFSNSSTSKLPSEVSKTTDTGLPATFAFAHATPAGEIEVRGYVSEAPCHKRIAQFRTLRCAMFEEQPAPGEQVARGPINKSEQGRHPIATRRQCDAGFVAQAVALQRRIVARDVGRVAG